MNEKPHKAMPHDLLADATPGNRKALARVFAHASGWLRDSDHAPPPELACWLAERLQSLANVLNDTHDKKLAGVNAALGLVEKGKRGNKARTPHNEALRRFLVWDVWMARKGNPEMTLPDVYELIRRRVAEHGVYVSESVVEKAWNARRELVPELEDPA